MNIYDAKKFAKNQFAQAHKLACEILTAKEHVFNLEQFAMEMHSQAANLNTKIDASDSTQFVKCAGERSELSRQALQEGITWALFSNTATHVMSTIVNAECHGVTPCMNVFVDDQIGQQKLGIMKIESVTMSADGKHHVKLSVYDGPVDSDNVYLADSLRLHRQ